jgi:hypothetical protein
MQDTSKIKERIIQIIRTKGPNFPSPIASEIQTSILFTSAFLSELLSDKQVKITYMRVGSSPIYYISGQESQLELFATKYLKSKEKEAFILLKENKIIKDSNQAPAIRIALREIKDYAIPYEKKDGLYWKYFLISEEEINSQKEEEILKKEENKEESSIQEEEIKEKSIKKNEKKKNTKKTNSNKKNDENFFNKIKENLSRKNIEILDIINFSKGEAILKIKNKDLEEILFAFNKKKISEKDIIKAFKKSLEYKLNYTIFSLGDSPKKIMEMISAIRKLSNIERID